MFYHSRPRALLYGSRHHLHCYKRLRDVQCTMHMYVAVLLKYKMYWWVNNNWKKETKAPTDLPGRRTVAEEARAQGSTRVSLPASSKWNSQEQHCPTAVHAQVLLRSPAINSFICLIYSLVGRRTFGCKVCTCTSPTSRILSRVMLPGNSPSKSHPIGIVLGVSQSEQ